MQTSLFDFEVDDAPAPPPAVVVAGAVDIVDDIIVAAVDEPAQELPADGGTQAGDDDGLVPVEAFALFGRDLFGNEVQPKAGGPLAERFLWPPFTVLDARAGVWQDRKRAWLSLGIKSEIGRTEDILFKSQAGLDRIQQQRRSVSPGGSARPACDYSKRDRGDGTDQPLTDADGDMARSGTSIFDPVICELSYRWFCPPGGTVLDPFAGGSVRGIVAAKLGYQYCGIDLRAEQVQANEAQAALLCGGDELKPFWLTGDSAQAATLAADLSADFVFSCPPYADLERYSDDPRDISTMTYEQFSAAYRAIIAAALSRLKADRFACFVVGDLRDKRGLYRGFPELTVAAFAAAGAAKYNEAVLVTSVGSLPIRVGKQFNAGRKLGKTHQNYLVFIKGDPKRAAEACNGQLDLPAVAG